MSSEGNRVALIVACNRYSDPKLKELQAPSQDAERFAKILEDPKIGGFKVATLIDQPHWIIAEKLNEFLKSCNKKDTLLLYFSCHGVKDEDGQLYFATVTTNRTLLYATGIDSIFVNRMLDRCQAQQKVVLLDCCYSGSFEKGSIAKSDMQVNVAELLGKGRVIITASDAMQYAFEGSDKVENLGIGGSYFTNGLIKGLESGEADVNNDGKITYSELYHYVYDYVKSITPNQTPTLNTRGVEGDFVVFKNMRDSAGSDEGKPLSPITGIIESVRPPVVQDPILEFVEKASMLLEEGDYDNAVKIFDSILTLRSEHIEALNGKGMALYKQRKYKEALECFNKVLKTKPKNLEARNYVEIINEKLSKEHDDGEAKASGKDVKQDTTTAALEKRTEEQVKKALNDSTQIPEEWIKKGDQLYEKELYQMAINYYDKALKIEPSSKLAWLKKGLALNFLGKYEEAIRCCEKALELDPNNAEAWNNKGLALYKEQSAKRRSAFSFRVNVLRYEEAISYYDKAIEIDANYADAWYNKGNALLDLDRYAEAVKCYGMASGIKPDYVNALVMQGYALINLHQYDKAVKCLDKALELDPNNGVLWQYKGYALEKLGNKKYAKECRKKAKELGYRG